MTFSILINGAIILMAYGCEIIDYKYFLILLLKLYQRQSMRRNNLRAVSFYEAQLATNYSKYKKLAEIQTKLALNDITNNQLLHQIQQLKHENQILRTKMAQKQMANILINTKSNTKTAISKVNSLLTHSNTSTMQALKSKCQDLQANSYQDLSNKVIHYFEKNKTNINSHHINTHQKSAKLDKNVYIDKPPLEKHFTLENRRQEEKPCPKNQGKQEQRMAVNRSLTEGNSKETNRENNQSKFPAHLNQFEGKKAQSRFLECSQMMQDPQNSMNKWNSQNEFGLKSEFLTRLKSGQLKKRKTYISVVSVSSKQNKKQKQN